MLPAFVMFPVVMLVILVTAFMQNGKFIELFSYILCMYSHSKVFSIIVDMPGRSSKGPCTEVHGGTGSQQKAHSGVQRCLAG